MRLHELIQKKDRGSLNEFARNDKGDSGGPDIKARYLGERNFKIVVNGETYLFIVLNIEVTAGQYLVADFNMTNLETGDEPNDDLQAEVVEYLDDCHREDIIKVADFHMASSDASHRQAGRDMGLVVYGLDDYIKKNKKDGMADGRVSDAQYNKEFDKANGQWEPSLPKIKPTHSVFINSKHWKDFETEEAAMKSATTVHNKKPRLRVDVMPIKRKGP